MVRGRIRFRLSKMGKKVLVYCLSLCILIDVVFQLNHREETSYWCPWVCQCGVINVDSLLKRVFLFLLILGRGIIHTFVLLVCDNRTKIHFSVVDPERLFQTIHLCFPTIQLDYFSCKRHRLWFFFFG